MTGDLQQAGIGAEVDGASKVNSACMLGSHLLQDQQHGTWHAVKDCVCCVSSCWSHVSSPVSVGQAGQDGRALSLAAACKALCTRPSAQSLLYIPLHSIEWRPDIPTVVQPLSSQPQRLLLLHSSSGLHKIATLSRQQCSSIVLAHAPSSNRLKAGKKPLHQQSIAQPRPVYCLPAALASALTCSSRCLPLPP